MYQLIYIDKIYYKPDNRKNRREISELEPLILMILALVCIIIFGYAIAGIRKYVIDNQNPVPTVTVESYEIVHHETESRRFYSEHWILEGQHDGETISIDITLLPDREIRLLEDNEGGNVDVTYYPETGILVQVGDYKLE